MTTIRPEDIPMSAPDLVPPTRAAFLADLWDAVRVHLSSEPGLVLPLLPVGNDQCDIERILELVSIEKAAADAERDGEPSVRIVGPDASELVARVEAALAVLSDDANGTMTPGTRNKRAIELLEGTREVPAYKSVVHVPPEPAASSLSDEQRTILGEMWQLVGGLSLAQVRSFRPDAGTFLSEMERTLANIGVEV